MSKPPRILFYFLHLLGVGHIYRAKRLIEGFHRNGMGVDVIYGGMPVADVTFEADSVHYLSPIRAADNAYSHYLDSTGNRLEKPFQMQRAEEITTIFDGLNPDLILTEAYPFGRRMVRHELAALLEAARQRRPAPLVVASVRDILQERKKPGRVEETCTVIDTYYDHILVHSDPKIIPLEATFPAAQKIADKIAYTGFVIPPTVESAVLPACDVVVSAGGGAFGGALMDIALSAAIDRPDLSWLLSTGPNLSERQFDALQARCPPHVQLVRYVANLAEQMKQSKVSVSQCGYNTAMDALAAHHQSPCRAVFVPYDIEGQSEQIRRSQLLEEAGFAINLPQSKLTSQSLNRAIDQAMLLPQVDLNVDFDGVENSARLLREWLEAR